MLNFIVSTATFSVAVYFLSRYFNKQNERANYPHTLFVMVIATLLSIGSGWTIDQLDGEAELHKNDPSLIEVVQSGDPLKIAKLLAGFN